MLAKIIIRSGGQTGVDRAALDIAGHLELAYRGWCPHGGWAEDHQTAPGLLRVYPKLQETPSSDPRQRTAWNVRDSDVTLILASSPALSRGTTFAQVCAELVFVKPWRIADLDANGPTPEIVEWISAHLQQRRSSALDLNIAGPRESEVPGIQHRAIEYLRHLLASLG